MIINPENYFYLHGGGVLRDSDELLASLRSMSDEVFQYHVNPGKNDFYNWIKEVIKDNVLSKRISAVKTKEQMIKIIEKRLAGLSKTKTKKKIIEEIKEAHYNE